MRARRSSPRSSRCWALVLAALAATGDGERLEGAEDTGLSGPFWDDDGGYFEFVPKESGEYAVQAFVVTPAGERPLGSALCELEDTEPCVAKFGWEAVGSEVRVQITKDGASGSSSEHFFVWSPQHCLLHDDLLKFSQPAQKCDGARLGTRSEGLLSKGLPDDYAFGVEFELVAREDGATRSRALQQHNDTDYTGFKQSRELRQDAVKACWHSLVESSPAPAQAALREWSVIEDMSVVAVREFSNRVHGGKPIVDPSIQNVYMEKLDESELDGIGIEVVSPLLRGSEGLDKMVLFLRAMEELGVQANPSGGLHVHINMLNSEIGGPMVSLRQYVAVLLSWVENQMAINSMQTCTRLAKPYAVILYADQSPVKDWFPLLHEMVAEIDNDDSAADRIPLLRRILNPDLGPIQEFLKNVLPDGGMFSQDDMNLPLTREVYDAYLALRKFGGWRGKVGFSAWRATFNYDSTTGFFEFAGQDAKGNVQFKWEKNHGSVEFRQHSGTYSPEDAARWVQFLAAFVTHYKQPEQVERVFSRYLGGGLSEGHVQLIKDQQQRSLVDLLEDLMPYIEEDSPEHFRAHSCRCEAVVPGAQEGVDGVKYDPLDGKVFSALQTRERLETAGSAGPPWGVRSHHAQRDDIEVADLR